MTQTEKRKKRLLREVLYFALGGLLGAILLFGLIGWLSREMILPGVNIARIEVGAMSSAQAEEKLKQEAGNYQVKYTFGDATFELPKDAYQLEIRQTAVRALEVGKKWQPEIWLGLLRGQVDLPLAMTLDENKYASWAAEINSAVTIMPQPARIELAGKSVKVTNGEDGIILDEERLRAMTEENLAWLKRETAEIPTTHKAAALSQEQITTVEGIADKMIGDVLAVKVDEETVRLGARELISFVSLDPAKIGAMDEKTINDYVLGIAERYARMPQDAKFEFRDGRVQEFAPGRDGIKVLTGPTAKLIEEAVKKLTTESKNEEVTAAVERTPPKITTGEVNDLGISERIGRGESYYAHSIANRIFNVGLASSRVTGALVAPGEEFSFNKFVGEISGATGYRTAYVISGGRTVLGDGGGVCQVSTTLFRAVMNAGLPITERWAHAYRVGYYEQNSDPGIDATVYSPSKDFRFVNDTPGHILVQAINDPKRQYLVFEIYGTNDGRKATVTKPKVWGVTPPPPDLYEDDPNLPAGTVRQVDWAAWGARTSFEYKVERDGNVIFEKTYSSAYRPWQNVFVRGTAGSPTP